ncbi:keratin-associated protein 5-5-like [Scylla paramamosain]|uniref:keratin-associated protein 5-5-like n=1 Tax=Scylla paramamosain TaxID=85552 RepID=UPI003082D31F
MCNADDEYISSDECASNVGECSCCKTCTPDQICAQEGGTCTKLSIGCASGFRKSILGGGCCTDECICCVPDACNSTNFRCTPDAYGTECRESCRNKRLQYETNIYCAINQTCCKACIPDPSCSEEGGICVTRNTGGCRGDLIESSNGKCCNSEFCACCVPNPQKSCWNATCLADDNPVVFQGGCNVIGDYRLKPDCGVACCKLCKPDSLCCSEGGRCYKGSCPP